VRSLRGPANGLDEVKKKRQRREEEDAEIMAWGDDACLGEERWHPSSPLRRCHHPRLNANAPRDGTEHNPAEQEVQDRGK
jgi:hypothetical protein